MRTNDLKKGAMVQLRNGWKAEIMDNVRGNIRMAKVYGFVTEIGSVYAHDILGVFNTENPSKFELVEHTPAQVKLRATVASF